MTAALHYIMNMTVPTVILVAAVILFRLIFRKAPKWINCLLWAVVGLRLMIPVRIETVMGLMPQRDIIDSGNVVNIFSPSFVKTVDNAGSYVSSSPAAVSVFSLEDLLNTVYFIGWIAGITLMLIFAAVSYLKIRKTVRASVKLSDGVYSCDYIETAFILGVFKPKIYLPSSLDEAKAGGILAHEKAHISRKDHWWKPLGYLLLSVYWFNPAVWAAYILLCRDIELACDEKVIKNMSKEETAAYSQLLLDCSSSRRLLTVCPLAFGEIGTKERIKNMLSYKKPAFRIIIAALIAGIAVAVCFGTGRKEKEPDEYSDTGAVDHIQDSALEDAIREQILKKNAGNDLGECPTASCAVLGTRNINGKIKAYCLTRFSRFGFENGCFTSVSGSMVPSVLTFAKESGKYSFADCEEAEDGSKYGSSIKRLFPVSLQSEVLNPSEDSIRKMDEECKAQAQSYLDSIGRKADIVDSIDRILFENVGITTEVSNSLLDITGRYGFPWYIGSTEKIENGVRYVYETAYDKESETVICTKNEYGTGNAVTVLKISANDGKTVSVNNSPASEKEVFVSLFNEERHQRLGTAAAGYVADLLNGADFSEPGYDNIPEITVTVGKEKYSYETSSGIFRKYGLNDEHCSFRVSDYERGLLNKLFGRYLILSSESSDEARTMTKADVIALSKKGENLTWFDLRNFRCGNDIGSGLYIVVYEIDGTYELTVGGGDPVREDHPLYAYLENTETNQMIDIMKESAEDFLK